MSPGDDERRPGRGGEPSSRLEGRPQDTASVGQATAWHAETIGSADAEVAVLGALLHVGGSGRRIAAELEPEDFTDPRCRLVLAAIRGCIARREPPCPVAVLAELRRTGHERSFLADRSAGVLLADLYAAVPIPASAAVYLRAVVEHRARRRVVEAADRLAQAAGALALDELHELVRSEAAAVEQQFARLDGAAAANRRAA